MSENSEIWKFLRKRKDSTDKAIILERTLICSMLSENRVNSVVAILLSILVIAINIYFVVDQVNNGDLTEGYLALIVIFGILYLLFCLYLVIHMSASMGCRSIANLSFVQNYVMTSDADSSPIDNQTSYSSTGTLSVIQDLSQFNRSTENILHS
ncbi:protein Malvolio-like [Ctenocephalides felis]|uniref:protein Malvolio-like n=1 Tax=Ctenocephalides felis TaxID=7515 RepID=UPI000E6E4FAC|nr:protein Malvolio-like [Ctenocephalides felis]